MRARLRKVFISISSTIHIVNNTSGTPLSVYSIIFWSP